MTFEIEYRIDGVALALQTNQSPMRDSNGVVVGVVGIARDVTRQKREQSAGARPSWSSAHRFDP